MRTYRIIIGATLASLATVAAACSAKDQNGVGGSSAVAQSGAPVVKPAVVSVHARDYAFTAPDQIPAGVTTFRFVNDGPGLHHMQLVRLDSGKTLGDLQQALRKPGPFPAWVVAVGGPNAPAPKGESNATLDLSAGTYAIICMVDVPEGVPHFAKGMVHPLTVTAAAAPAPEPKADITVALQDYGFTISQPITAGTHTLAVSNSAAQPHEVELVRLAPGKTAQDVVSWVAGGMKGPPPGEPIGGVSAINAGQRAEFSTTFTKGDYAFICFLPDAKDGKPHFLHGMMHTVTVS